MILEELIYKRFSESKELSQQLAKYAGKPAVFSPVSPENNQEGWNGKTQYPRVTYYFDFQTNEERSSVGTLSVFLYCQNTDEVVPEDMEAAVKNCLKDVLLKPENGIVYAFTWARTDAFELMETKIIGSEIRFDILEYPCQETTDPDPIMATNQYIKRLYPNCVVVGLDRMEEITEASKEKPILYCRLIQIEKSQETNMVAWMDGRIAIHILCPDSEVRLKMAADIAKTLSLEGEITLLDHSPMLIHRLQLNNQSDYLKAGQLFITGHYGLLRYKAQGHSLRHINNTIK